MVDTTINELSGLSRKLNQKSDKLNSIIAEVNKKLKNLNFGIETWLTTLPVELSDVETTDENWNPCDPWRSITYLGYCSVEDEWQLAVKEAVLTEKRNFDGDTYDSVSDSTVKPLLKATRPVRTKAMNLIPSLLTQIQISAQQTLASIEKAEEAAANL